MMDRGKLTEALRSVDHGSVEDCFLQSPLFGKAADMIEAQAARIAALETALRPFLVTAQPIDDLLFGEKPDTAIMTVTVQVPLGSVRRARALLDAAP